jgi:cytochrome b pre-mRNA-processing protein 3
MAFAFLNKFFGGNDPREAMRPLYDAVTAEARTPAWYLRGAVPDTMEGRFDLMCLVTSVVLLKLEDLGEEAQAQMAWLTELFVDDMEGQMREVGYGDVVVGKQVGKMMGALGGRLGACRNALGGGEDLSDMLERNLYRGTPPAPDALDFSQNRLKALVADLSSQTLDQLMAGEIRP